MLRHLLRAASRLGVTLGVMAVAGMAAGCAPSDPLDREVEAHTLAELDAWVAGIRRSVDRELAQEIELVFVNLAAETPRFRKATTEHELHQPGNPLCRRVDGRRLRDVMIDSYSAAITTLSNQNSIDADNVLRLSAVVNLDRAEAFEDRLAKVRATIVRRDEQIAQHRERIAQLRR